MDYRSTVLVLSVIIYTMNSQDKLAIENLIIIARYMEQNSVLTDDDQKLLDKSICHAERLIGISPTEYSEAIELSNISRFDIDSIVEAIKHRKKS